MSKFYIIIMIIILQGCSVSTAMKGMEPPDLSLIHIGAEHKIVDATLGQPRKVVMLSNGKRLFVYKNLARLSPSAKDFVTNLSLDLASAVLWEFIPYNNRKLKTYYITYDNNDKVDSINKYIDRNDA